MQNKQADRKKIRFYFTICFLSLFTVILHAQAGRSEIKLVSKDNLTITADIFIQSDTLPYLVLLHEQGSSRGEFLHIIQRFQKMNINCLVPDLRNGGNSNVVVNETAAIAALNNYSLSADMVLADIDAAVEYALDRSQKKVIIMGAGANGSLALIEAVDTSQIRGVVAMSPGEFFRPQIVVEDEIADLQVPVLVTCTKSEYPYVHQLLSNVDPEIKSIFTPDFETNNTGTRALDPENKNSLEYWLSVLLFFNDIL